MSRVEIPFLGIVVSIFKTVAMSYASPLIQKLHPHVSVTSTTYKPIFHGSHLSHNTSYGGAAMSRSLMVNFVFIFSFHFILFLFLFLFYFLFLEQLGLGVKMSHQSQVDGIITRLITRLRRME